jgi:WhiB family redox-sensing transcriptional regulator
MTGVPGTRQTFPTAGEWRNDAICTQVDPELFFPEKDTGNAKAAKDVCKGCPVRRECLHYALTYNERFGVWGGMSERERRKLRGDAA